MHMYVYNTIDKEEETQRSLTENSEAVNIDTSRKGKTWFNRNLDSST